MEWALLRGLSDAEVEQVLALGRRRRFGRREVIWHAGDRAETIYLIHAGRLAVQFTTSMGDVVTVIVLGAGEIAGIVGGLGSDPFWTTSGVALEPTETMAIRMSDLTEARHRLPSLNEAVIRFLADRTLELADRLADALYTSADTRVLRRLVVLCDLYQQGDGEVVIPLTQEDLAELAGVTRPTVNRVLKKEEGRGTLRISRGSVTITDRERLVARTK